MTINEYQIEALRTENGMSICYPHIFVPIEFEGRCLLSERTYLSKLLNGLIGLNGEAGEAIDILKKYLFQGHELNVEHIAKELGDVAWYLAVSADAIGYKLEDILQMNVDKLKKRYPNGFKTELSINRNENDI